MLTNKHVLVKSLEAVIISELETEEHTGKTPETTAVHLTQTDIAIIGAALNTFKAEHVDNAHCANMRVHMASLIEHIEDNMEDY